MYMLYNASTRSNYFDVNLPRTTLVLMSFLSSCFLFLGILFTLSTSSSRSHTRHVYKQYCWMIAAFDLLFICTSSLFPFRMIIYLFLFSIFSIFYFLFFFFHFIFIYHFYYSFIYFTQLVGSNL